VNYSKNISKECDAMNIAEQRVNAQLDFARMRREMEAKREDERQADKRAAEAARQRMYSH
jgi:hypothetical protein